MGEGEGGADVLSTSEDGKVCVRRVSVPCPSVRLSVEGKGEATVAVHGGHLVSWRVPRKQGGSPGGEMEELLFLSEKAEFAAPKAIRGGARVCFPQFADGAGVKGMAFGNHGFARNSDWKVLERECVADAGGAVAVLELSAAAEGAGRGGLAGAVPEAWAEGGASSQWQLQLQVTLTPHGQLQVRFAVLNHAVDQTLGPLQLLFHAYFRVADVAAPGTQVTGLEGCPYWDSLAGEHQVEMEGSDAPVAFPEGANVDRIYLDNGDHVKRLVGAGDRGDRVISLATTELPDAVVWNPGPAKAALLADLHPGGEKHFVCVEPGRIRDPAVVAPSGAWMSEIHLACR